MSGEPKGVTLVVGGNGMLAGATRWLTQEKISEVAIQSMTDRRSRIVGERAPP
jgi:hypothetical protein